MFPPIQGILAFDTPYNGLARSMFVYGAFSNYQKVSNVFNVMTALSAAAPATISKLVTSRAAKTASTREDSPIPAWKAWQLVAIRTGTVGAIAAGGVAAYVHRKQIIEGAQSVRNLNKESVIQGYHRSIGALGQGLAIINRDNIGQSFAWLSDHLTFVSALMKQNELNRRLQRLAALRGVGIHDYYASMGENGYWSGGYFVPERTFCAIPDKDQSASRLFARHVVADAPDEIACHVSLFNADINKGYERMTDETANLVVRWFGNETALFDDIKIGAETKSEQADEIVKQAMEQAAQMPQEQIPDEKLEEEPTLHQDQPYASPIDIVAAPCLIHPNGSTTETLDNSQEEDRVAKERDVDTDSEARNAYIRYLFDIAHQAGANAKFLVPSKIPKGKISLPTMPTVLSMPKIPSAALPSILSFSRTSNNSISQLPTEGDQTGRDSSSVAAEDRRCEEETTSMQSSREMRG
jgi:hypothetical protein